MVEPTTYFPGTSCYVGHMMHGFLVELNPGLIVGVPCIEKVYRNGLTTEVVLRGEQEFACRCHSIYDPDNVLWNKLRFLCSA
jgi:hypothetical protein